MSEKTKKNNDQEDELNQSRFQVERGVGVGGTETPTSDGILVEEEDILDTKSRFREQPGSLIEPSEAASESPFYGQGFDEPDDKGIKRTPGKEREDEKGSLGN